VTGSLFPRKSEEAAIATESRGVNVSIVRLPPSVHGEGDHGFISALIKIARQKGVSAYVGDGLNRWPAVHQFDAALLYRLVLEKASMGGRYHGVADEGVPFRDIANVIGRHLNVSVVSKSRGEADEHFGWLAHFVGIDCPAFVVQNATSPQANFGYWDSAERAMRFRESLSPTVVRMEFRLAELKNPARQHGVRLGQVAARQNSVDELKRASIVMRAESYRRRLFSEFDRAKEMFLP
jgi:hypothetical protein